MAGALSGIRMTPRRSVQTTRHKCASLMLHNGQVGSASSQTEAALQLQLHRPVLIIFLVVTLLTHKLDHWLEAGTQGRAVHLAIPAFYLLAMNPNRVLENE
jgi:hypothetical protein